MSQESPPNPANAQAAPFPAEVDGVNTDGRPQLDWQSKYPTGARRQQHIECCYVAGVLVISLLAIFLTWYGTTSDWLGLGGQRGTVFRRYSYFCFGGLLGGTVFGAKYLYRVCARGWWTEDRRLWRILSPWLSLIVALIVGTFMHSGVITAAKAMSSPLALGLGFVIGYFSDHALLKMQEIAEVLFGKPESSPRPGARGPDGG
jgi:membrane protease YdiL (CAAX protease family)